MRTDTRNFNLKKSEILGRIVIMDKKIGIALGGGAVRGLAHIGVLKVFEKYKIPITYIAGTSMGAIIGGLFAAGLSAQEIEDIALKLNGKKALKIFSPSWSHSGFIDGKNITKYLSSLLPDRNISGMPIQFRAVATDFFTGEKFIIEKGSLWDAVRASSSIPVIFTPAVSAHKILLDGGLSDPLPTSVVKKMGADIVVSVNVVPEPEYKKNVRSKKSLVKNLAARISNWKLLPLKKAGKHIVNIEYSHKKRILPSLMNISMQTRNIIEYNLILMDGITNKPDFLIEPNKNVTIGWFEFDKAAEIIKNGEKAAMEIIEPLMKKINS